MRLSLPALMPFAVSLVLTSVARAAPPPVQQSGRVAVIDVVRVFNEYQRQRDLTEEMTHLQQRLDAESRSRRDRIDAVQKELQMFDPNDPAYKQKMSDLLRMQVEYKNWFDLKQAELTREVAVWTWKIYKEICDAVAAYAREQGIGLVVYRDQFPEVTADPEELRNRIRQRMVVYFEAQIDVTQTILDRLNAQYRAQPADKMLDIE